MRPYTIDERSDVFYDPEPFLNFEIQSKSNQNNKFWMKSPSANKLICKKILQFFSQSQYNFPIKFGNCFPSTQSKSGPDRKFLKR